MPETIGSGSFMYEPLVSFEQLPAGMTMVEIPDVDVDREDNVYLLTRNPANPIIVLAPDGRFLRTFARARSASKRTVSRLLRMERSSSPTTGPTRSRAGHPRASC